MQAKAEKILKTAASPARTPRTLALELKAELIRQLCHELLINHDRVTRLERMLRKQMLPATGQTLATMLGIGTILAAMIVGETTSVTRFRSRAARAVYNGTAPARHSTSGGRERHKARRACNHRLKRAFWLAARAAALHDPFAVAYFIITNASSGWLDICPIAYSLLKSGCDYDRAIVEQAIQKRQEQVANADGSRVEEALPVPDPKRPSRRSHDGN